MKAARANGFSICISIFGGGGIIIPHVLLHYGYTGINICIQNSMYLCIFIFTLFGLLPCSVIFGGCHELDKLNNTKHSESFILNFFIISIILLVVFIIILGNI